MGAFHGAARARIDFLWILDLYNQGKIKLDELISRYRISTNGFLARQKMRGINPLSSSENLVIVCEVYGALATGMKHPGRITT